MSFNYINFFEKILLSRDKNKFNNAWNEYRYADSHTGEEFKSILKIIKNSEFVIFLKGKLDQLLEVMDKIDFGKNQDLKLDVLDAISNIVDDQNDVLANIILKEVRERYKNTSNIEEYIKLSDISSDVKSFISKVRIMTYVKKGEFVYHLNGWGIGEVLDTSLDMEIVKIDFEGSNFVRRLDIRTIYQNIIPIKKDHFLVLRFINPESLHKLALTTPEDFLIKMVKDLKSIHSRDFQSILVDSIIPENKWAYWWDKVKKIARSSNKIIIGHDSVWRFSDEEGESNQTIEDMSCDCSGFNLIKKLANTAIKSTNFVDDESFKDKVRSVVKDIRSSESIENRIYVNVFSNWLEIISDEDAVEVINHEHDVQKVIKDLAKTQFKKNYIRLLTQTNDAVESLYKIFISQSIRQYRAEIDKIADDLPELREKIDGLMDSLNDFSQENKPELSLWYIQKNIESDKSDHKKIEWVQRLIKLIYTTEKDKDFSVFKKAITILRKHHYKVFRHACSMATEDQIRDAVLFAERSKELLNNDIRILKSVASVAIPGIFDSESVQDENENVVWTTEEGRLFAQQELDDIVSNQMVDNAKGIKRARSYGDLRENYEYKSELDRRRELQSKAKRLMSMLQKSKILRPFNVDINSVNAGCSVAIKNTSDKIEYTILGPWDTNPELGIISFDAAIAKSLIGKKIGDSVDINGESYFIDGISIAKKVIDSVEKSKVK